MKEKIYAVISVLWVNEDPLVGWGFGPSKRSARRAAELTLKPAGRTLKEEDFIYVTLKPGQQYHIWGNSEVKTFRPTR